MALHLTPEMLAQGYELLRVTPPFKRWKLPHADDIEFCVIRTQEKSADYTFINGRHRIRVNAHWCGHLAKMLADLAHEMVHLHLQVICPNDRAVHGWRFHRCAAQVCRHHVFDPKGF